MFFYPVDQAAPHRVQHDGEDIGALGGSESSRCASSKNGQYSVPHRSFAVGYSVTPRLTLGVVSHAAFRHNGSAAAISAELRLHHLSSKWHHLGKNSSTGLKALGRCAKSIPSFLDATCTCSSRTGDYCHCITWLRLIRYLYTEGAPHCGSCCNLCRDSRSLRSVSHRYASPQTPALSSYLYSRDSASPENYHGVFASEGTRYVGRDLQLVAKRPPFNRHSRVHLPS